MRSPRRRHGERQKRLRLLAEPPGRQALCSLRAVVDTPQAQLVYSSVDFDTFNDQFGARVSLQDGDSLLGRLGLALDREESLQRADGETAQAKSTASPISTLSFWTVRHSMSPVPVLKARMTRSGPA
ncbi:autotransporter outer membrane beta-barrel domain-containing protein [Rhizobium hidalgonense]|uniref:autotransporter outer membrane beta-barrel domain-containing protein n=1 Tax=Rhizobium hidalgonense TaxID=1538159 RepID=UPI0013E404CD